MQSNMNELITYYLHYHRYISFVNILVKGNDNNINKKVAAYFDLQHKLAG